MAHSQLNCLACSLHSPSAGPRLLPNNQRRVPARLTDRIVVADLVRTRFTLVIMLGVGALSGFRWQTSMREVLAAISAALALKSCC